MHHRTIYSLGVGVLLVLSVSIAPVTALSLASAGDERGRAVGDVTDATAADQTESAAITALEAMRIAQNETNGTVVGVQRTQANQSDDGTPAYEVKVVQGNRSGDEANAVDRRLLAVQVHATNGTILSTERQTNEGGFFDTDESAGGIAVSDSLNLSTTRSAVNATEIAINESEEANLTAREVRLTLRDQQEGNATTPPLVYEVEVENDQGDRVTVVVSARKGEEGVITVEPQQDDEGGS